MAATARRLKVVDSDSPAYATPEAVESKLSEWDDNVLTCRTFGHNFEASTATKNNRLKYWRLIRKCARCKAEKVMEVSLRGQVYSSFIDYSPTDGYLASGLGRIIGAAKDVVRLAAITRTFDIRTLTAAEAREDLPRSHKTRVGVGMED